MVGGVDSAVGSSAYVKGAQLSSGSRAPNKPADNSDKESAPVSFVREKDEVSSKPPVEETKTASSERSNDSTKTELQAKNDDSTLRTEQTRGSLLDIAV